MESCVTKAVTFSGTQYCLVHDLRLVGWNIKFPAKLADVGYPEGENPGAGNFEGEAGSKGKALVVEGVAADTLEQLPRTWSADIDHRAAVGDVRKLDRAAAVEVLPDPGEVVSSKGRAGDDVDCLLYTSDAADE